MPVAVRSTQNTRKDQGAKYNFQDVDCLLHGRKCKAVSYPSNQLHNAIENRGESKSLTFKHVRGMV